MTDLLSSSNDNLGKPGINWDQVRDDFPVLQQQINGHPLVYFDNAATSQKPRAVIEALRRYYERDNSNVHRGIHELSLRATEAFERSRAIVARFLGAPSPDELVFTRGTTEAINLVVRAWGETFLRAGDVVLLTEMEHHSNLVPWQLLAQKLGIKLRFLPLQSDYTLGMKSLADFLTPEVRLFAFTHVSNSLGTINPAREFCEAARNIGAVSLVDGAQSAGHMTVNVSDLGCDFYAFSGHKMCGPTGIGGLFGRRELLESMPPWHGGGEMIESVTYERSTFKAPPQRFEAGTPNIADAIALGAAVEYLESVGRDRIFEHDSALAAFAVRLLSEIPGIRILGPENGRAGLVSFASNWAHPHDISTFVDAYGIAVRGGHHCNQPLMKKLGLPGTTRASFYFYNTETEVEKLAEILRKAYQFFA